MRFNTDRALFDAFPSARDHIKTEPTGVLPSVFLRDLLKRDKLEEAISFCAYLLRRREAVAWGCGCLRAQRRDAPASADPALEAAEAWAEAPSEERRLHAYERWTAGDKEDPASWLALGAAWSGGDMMPNMANTVPAPAHLTATAVRVALLLTSHRIAAAAKAARVRDWIAAGDRLAETGL